MSLRTELLTELRNAYDLQLDKDSEAAKDKIATVLARVKNVGASDREAMDALRSRDWARYKRYKDYAREKGWLEK